MTDDDDDTEKAYEMHGTIAEWNGRSGHVLTDCGERVFLNRFTLKMLGFRQAPKVGDRIHFWASEHVEISCRIQAIRMIVPQEPDEAALARLREVNRAVRRERHPEDEPRLEAHPGAIECHGTVDSFDPAKGYGFIRRDDGELILLHVTCLRASGYQCAAPGNSVRFQAMQGRDKGWHAYRILSLS